MAITKELRMEQVKFNALATLGPLGFVDSDDVDDPKSIQHPVIGSFDCSTVTLKNVIKLAFEAGQEKGSNALRKQFRELMWLAPDHPDDDH